MIQRTGAMDQRRVAPIALLSSLKDCLLKLDSVQVDNDAPILRAFILTPQGGMIGPTPQFADSQAQLALVAVIHLPAHAAVARILPGHDGS
ncbi:MAG: hypothetical protein ACK53F_07720 [Betaproteobacteria bacterium]